MVFLASEDGFSDFLVDPEAWEHGGSSNFDGCEGVRFEPRCVQLAAGTHADGIEAGIVEIRFVE